MERFKNFEKEVKTKTYSKVGLSLKRNKLSPEQREAVDWIQEQRDTLKVTRFIKSEATFLALATTKMLL